MNFYIKKNSTLPKLKFELINDGRSDYLLNTALSNSDTFYLSLWDTEKKSYKTTKKECTITSELNEDGLLSYFINYQFSLGETKESTTFEVQISYIDERGTDIFPIKEKIYCIVEDSFFGGNQTNNSRYKLNISCCSSSVDFPSQTPPKTPVPTPSVTPTPTPTNTPTSIPANTLNYLYVSPFIDRNDGVLADIELVNPGSGYTTPFVSATTIVGGSGTGGRIILNVDTGTTRAVGTFIYDRGNNYSNTISVTFPTPPGGTAAQVNVYANQKQAILGYPVYENQLLQLCSNNGINALIFYDLNFMDWATNGSGTTSAPGKTMLKNFIEKARLSGITHISAARGWDTTGNSQTQINQIRDYHSWATTSGFTNGYFDSITTEIEWWVTSDRTVFDSVVYGLNYAKSTLTSPSVQVNVYLGKGNYYYGTDPAMLSTKVDKWFVSTYMSTSRANTIGELYTDTRGNSSGLYRMKNIATAYTSTSKTKVLPIYSVESKLDQWNRNGGFNGTNYNTIDPNSSEDFMGTYFTGNTVSTSWNSWVGNQSYPTNSSFYTENDSDIRNNINVEGVVLFFSKLFDISR
jgi:hypothetical protein